MNKRARSRISLEILDKIDRRILYFLLLFLITFAFIRPIGLPISINPLTRETYQTIKDLEPGSVIVWSFSVHAGDWPDIGIAVKPIMQHCFELPIKLIIVDFYRGEGASLAESVLDSINKGDKIYGEDWVNLGFYAGLHTTAAAFFKDVWMTAPIDFYGNPVETLPLMQNVRDYNDIDFLFGSDSEGWAVAQGYTPYGIPVISVGSTKGYTSSMWMYEAGQLEAIVGGVRGGAEYEILMKSPGMAVAALDAQSLAHILAIVFIIIGNISYFIEKSGYKERKM